MTVILDMGEFWIEAHTFNVTVNNAAGRYLSVQQNMDRAGRLVGLAVAMGGVQGIGDLPATIQAIFNGGSIGYTYGAFITNINAYLYKGVGGVNGDVDSCVVMCFMRR